MARRRAEEGGLNWFALGQARAHDAAQRLPFLVDGALVGSVARQHLGSLAGWPQALHIAPDAVDLRTSPDRRDAALESINAALRERGLIRGWRDELYAVTDLASGTRLATIERAASRFWGTLTLGAHANGYVADARGRPTHLWIARRSATKSTDPGLYDNLIGGGVPSHQTPGETVVREGFEEAGIDPARMAQARQASVLHVLRDVPHGLQREDLHTFDLQLPPGLVPQNQDGEVQGFACMPVPEALALAATEAMTVDAALVTLDFAVRHGLLPDPEARALAPSLQKLFAKAHVGDQNP